MYLNANGSLVYAFFIYDLHGKDWFHVEKIEKNKLMILDQKILYKNSTAADGLSRRNSSVVDELKKSFFCFFSTQVCLFLIKNLMGKDFKIAEKIEKSVKKYFNLPEWTIFVDIVR
jgi:hypothetical protein